ncbi:MAG: hypothetical protein V3W43_17065, partial [Desulfatiglandaceae bacterium]
MDRADIEIAGMGVNLEPVCQSEAVVRLADESVVAHEIHIKLSLELGAHALHLGIPGDQGAGRGEIELHVFHVEERKGKLVQVEHLAETRHMGDFLHDMVKGFPGISAELFRYTVQKHDLLPWLNGLSLNFSFNHIGATA